MPLDAKDARKRSKLLSLVLRHQPETLGLRLDPEGYVDVEALLRALTGAGLPTSRDELEGIVTTSDKQRFAFHEDRTRLRASQGHSLPVDLGLTPQMPPEALFHGTAHHRVEAILASGLRPGSRQHVHLSADVATARRVGARHGAPCVLVVNAAAMAASGLHFFRAANGVWLTLFVPAVYLRAATSSPP